MIQEYLINNENEKDEISEYKPEQVKSTLISVEDGECYYVQYSVSANDEKAARKISEVDTYVRLKFNLTILRNDCSEYFMNKLFPLISQFERKLRKLLYMFSNIKKDEESSKRINDLESMDFGELFTMLFVDVNFMKNIKDLVKNRDKEYFSKREILDLVKNEEENTVWNKLLGNEVVPTLISRFNDIRKVRNDISHSHNISYEEYITDRKLIKKVNKEIDCALDNVDLKEEIAKRPVSFGKTLADAIIANEEYLKSFQSVASSIANMASANSAVMDSLQGAVQASSTIANFSGIKNMQNIAGSIATIADNPSFVEAQNAARRIASIYEKNPMLQQIAKQQQIIADITAPIEAVRAQQNFLNSIYPNYKADSGHKQNGDLDADSSASKKSDNKPEGSDEE